jgi:hypothetical protein
MINININMIAERRARRIREMATLRISTLMVICVTVVLVLWNATNWFSDISAQAQLKTVNRQLERQKPSHDQWSDVQKQIKANKPVVDLLRDVQTSECAWMTLFSDLSKITPPGVLITSQAVTGSDKNMEMKISGKAADEKTFADFMMAFSQHTTWAGQPKFSTWSYAGEKSGQLGYSFDLTIPINGMTGGDL